MYSTGDSYFFFCCELGQIGALQEYSGYGLCEPAGQIVPAILLAPTISQDRVPAASATSATSISRTTDTVMATTNGVYTHTTTSITIPLLVNFQNPDSGVV
jgi:hypothetical protein